MDEPSEPSKELSLEENQVTRLIQVVLVGCLIISTLVVPQAAGAGKACRSPRSAYDAGGQPNRGALFDDPLFSQQWGLRQLNVPGAWKQGAFGKGTVIAVIDTGVDLHHPDLRRNLVRGDDLGPEGAPRDCPGPQDEDGHGTHAAGVAAATGDNGIGIVGVAPKARVMPIQVTDLEEMQSLTGGDERLHEINQRVAEGIRYAADHGADVINISMSTFFYVEMPGTGVSDAIEYAWSKGVLTVAAAGNEGMETPNEESTPDEPCLYPASDPLVLCVGATDRRGKVTGYSSDPAKPTGEPGVLGPAGNETNLDCESSNLTWSTALPTDWDCGVGGYATNGGTSVASPAVAGVAALLFGLGLDHEEVLDCIVKTASNNGEYDRSTGFGIVNAEKAVVRCA